MFNIILASLYNRWMWKKRKVELFDGDGGGDDDEGQDDFAYDFVDDDDDDFVDDDDDDDDDDGCAVAFCFNYTTGFNCWTVRDFWKNNRIEEWRSSTDIKMDINHGIMNIGNGQLPKNEEIEPHWTTAQQKYKIQLKDTNIKYKYKIQIQNTTKQARKPRSYASPKLRLTHLLTGVKCRATSVAKKRFTWNGLFPHLSLINCWFDFITAIISPCLIKGLVDKSPLALIYLLGGEGAAAAIREANALKTNIFNDNNMICKL